MPKNHQRYFWWSVDGTYHAINTWLVPSWVFWVRNPRLPSEWPVWAVFVLLKERLGIHLLYLWTGTLHPWRETQGVEREYRSTGKALIFEAQHTGNRIQWLSDNKTCLSISSYALQSWRFSYLSWLEHVSNLFKWWNKRKVITDHPKKKISKSKY